MHLFGRERVVGVFLRPLEYQDDNASANRTVLDQFDRKDLPIVLLDYGLLTVRQPRRMAELKELSGTRKSLHVTYVTTYGLRRNSYAKNVQSEVTLDDLF